MKIRIKEILVLSMIISGLTCSLKAQDSLRNNRSGFALYGYYPMFWYDNFITDGEAVFQIAFEKNWRSLKHLKWNYSCDLLFGREFYRSSKEPNRIYSEAVIGFDFSMYYGLNNHFIELGAGTDSWGLLKAIIGYRMNLKNHFLFKLQLMPSTMFLGDIATGHDQIVNYFDIGLGLGYRFNPISAKQISKGLGFFYHRSYLGLEAFMFRFEKEVSSPVPSWLFNYSFMPFILGNFRFIVNAGAGSEAGGGTLYQTGIASLYGRNKHFMETGLNLLYVWLLNPNFNYDKYSGYILLQPQLGYRYQFLRNRLYAKIAYAPCIRIHNWKGEKGLNQNMVLGLGFKLAKDKE